MKVVLRDEFIKLGQALKAAGLAQTGSMAKDVIQNGEVEKRRGRKLYDGDEVVFAGETVTIVK